MYIEKNMFENIFNMIMDMKGKINDNIKARMDITLFYHRNNMDLVYIGSWVTKPKASFTLDNNA